MRSVIRRVLFVLAVAALVPSSVFAQAVLTGVVKDDSGAVLPGVTVEASGPALIEKVRSAITDGTGQYRLVDLPPSTYDVTFALTGFSTVKREGITLTGTATTTVNGELKVGSVAETITVTGAAPLVDVQGVATEHSVTRELLESVPTSRQIHAVATLIPGILVQGGSANPNVADVGGSALSFTPQASIHGGVSGDQRQLLQGLPLAATASGNTTDFQLNLASIQELTIDTAGMSAEDYSGGVRLNVVPREGGNQFHTLVYVDGAGPSLQSSNYTDSLAARGYPTPKPLKPLQKAYTINPAFGGPIVKDKLWFYAAVNRSRNATYVAIAPNLNAGNPNAWTYAPDPNGTFPSLDVLFYGENARLTWQASPKNKLAFYYDTQYRCTCPQATAALSPEAQSSRVLPVMHFASVGYTAPLSNKLVVDFSAVDRLEPSRTTDALNTDPSIIPVIDSGTGITYRNYASEAGAIHNRNNDVRGSLSYVTGAHSFKTGFLAEWARNRPSSYAGTNNVVYRFTNGTPNQITEFADPRGSETRANEFGMFVQDRWTVKRLTLTGGLRFDYYHTYFPAQTLGPVLLAPTRNITFPASDGAALKDPSYRLGGAYDVFGDGKTAVKVSFNKYVNAMNTGTSGTSVYNFGIALNPANLVATSTTRSWTDSNKNFTPDCNLLNPALNGECGALANSGFGQPITTNTYDPNLLSSWNKRQFNKELVFGLQQQVLERLSLDVTYIRRWYGNVLVTDNLAVAPSDYTQFSIVAPVDSRLPNGGGYAISGLYDVNPNRFGQTNNWTTLASNYADVTRNWRGLDVLANVRAMRGLTFQGGLSTGSTFQDLCGLKSVLPEYARSLTTPFPATSPTDPYCSFQTNWLTQIKGLGTYTVPRVDVQVSAAFQSMPGPQIVANYAVPNAAIVPSLGRSLAGNAANATVNLVQPGSLYGERMNTVDLRLGKIFRFAGRGRVSGNIDIFNAFNASTVIIQNDTYATTSTTWQQPQTVIAPRLIKFSAQFDF
ncbi:MAG: carboxypeptidase regulatory-like domain-containing protein [Acidobacteriota bacterium]